MPHNKDRLAHIILWIGIVLAVFLVSLGFYYVFMMQIAVPYSDDYWKYSENFNLTFNCLVIPLAIMIMSILFKRE